MKTLFLGLGKVNTSLASLVSGEKWALNEVEGELSVLKYESSKFVERRRQEGSFDTLDWSEFLPARVFISPGVDPRRPFFQHVKDFEVKELSFFSSRFEGQVICITGTDGKSTCTFQLGEILKRAMPHKKIFVGGNLGTAMAEALKQDYELAVLEVSSFQTERLNSGRFDLGLIINLDTDHLDRYDTLADYHAAKWNLLRFCREVAYPEGVKVPESVKPSVISFQNKEDLTEIIRKLTQHLAQIFHFEFTESLFQSLPTLPHRLEVYYAKEGRLFVNDSKATTVHAVSYGLKRIQEQSPRVVLILGGKYKGDDFSRLIPVLRPSDEVWIYGEARHKIEKQVSNWAKKRVFATLADLLKQELPDFPDHTSLVLSPGCSSYDEFDNFEERGNFFISEVEKNYEISRSQS